MFPKCYCMSVAKGEIGLRSIILVLAVSILVTLAFASLSCGAPVTWTENYLMDKSDLSSTGSSPYFILEPGYQTVYKGGETDLIITVLKETKMVDGVETRIIEERESEAGKLIEVSRNYFAISKKNNTVFYFGEDVDMYKDGKITDHGGSWLAGVGGARAGVAIPSIAYVGARYYQEVAPKVAMDRAEIVSVTETLDTPAGKFVNVVKTEETSSLEPGKGYKLYAPGVGLIKDADVVLVKYGKIK